jgi:hypothetical protein
MVAQQICYAAQHCTAPSAASKRSARPRSRGHSKAPSSLPLAFEKGACLPGVGRAAKLPSAHQIRAARGAPALYVLYDALSDAHRHQQAARGGGACRAAGAVLGVRRVPQQVGAGAKWWVAGWGLGFGKPLAGSDSVAACPPQPSCRPAAAQSAAAGQGQLARRSAAAQERPPQLGTPPALSTRMLPPPAAFLRVPHPNYFWVGVQGHCPRTADGAPQLRPYMTLKYIRHRGACLERETPSSQPAQHRGADGRSTVLPLGAQERKRKRERGREPTRHLPQQCLHFLPS